MMKRTKYSVACLAIACLYGCAADTHIQIEPAKGHVDSYLVAADELGEQMFYQYVKATEVLEVASGQ